MVTDTVLPGSLGSLGIPTLNCTVNVLAADAPLVQGTVYYFRVFATINNVAGSPTGASNGVAAIGVSQPPTNVVATPAGVGSASLQWDAPSNDGGSDITGYLVMQDDTTADQEGFVTSGTCAAADETIATSCQVDGLTPGHSYTFTVGAFATVGAASSAQSSPSQPITILSDAPGPPTGVTAVAGVESATISWTAPVATGSSAITGYTVYYYPSADESPAPIAATGDCGPDPVTALTCTATGLETGVGYIFQVLANNTGHQSEPGDSNEVTPSPADPVAPNPPTAVTASPGDGAATVSWTAPSSGGGGLVGYNVQIKTSPSGSFADAGTGCSPASTNSSTATTCTATGLTNGTSYVFQVATIGTDLPSSYSSPADAVTPVGPPGAPTAVTGAAGNTQVAVSWTAPSSNGGAAVTGYTVQIAAGVNGSFADYAGAGSCASSSTSTSVSCLATGLTNGTAYLFRVKAWNDVDRSGAYSANSAAITPLGAPGIPTSVTGYASRASAVVTWNAPSSSGLTAITRYSVQQAPSVSGPWTAAGGGCATAGTSLSCTASPLTDGSAYSFRVAAVSTTGTSDWSTASAAVTPASNALPEQLAARCPGGSCAGANLIGLNLSGVNLAGVNLAGANLTGANLSGANLAGANLTGATLTAATMTGVNLAGANLTSATLIAVVGTGANYHGANFTKASLVAAKLGSSDLAGANFTSANMVGTSRSLTVERSLPARKLTPADFKKSNLNKANFKNAKMAGVNLKGAKLAKAKLAKADLHGANLSGSNLKNASFKNANLIKANLKNANTKGTNFTGAKMAGAKR